MKPRVAVSTGEGLNTDLEMQYAFEFAGANAERVHVLDLLSGEVNLRDYQIIVIPGGFLHGDDIASAKVFATQLRYRMKDELLEFAKGDKLILDICNGFQGLAKSGILPYADFNQSVTLTNNDSGRFEDRWVYLEVDRDSPCVFTRGIERLYLPVRHGEGKFYAENDVLDTLEENNQVVVRYVGKNGERDPQYPENPNGSLRAIAGICDPSGRIYGMMPHPEAFVWKYQHPRWTREQLPEEGDGLRIFRNAVEYFR